MCHYSLRMSSHGIDLFFVDTLCFLVGVDSVTDVVPWYFILRFLF